MADVEIYFRQINLNNRIDATAEIEAGINQIHLLQEPYTNIVKGECGVDKKNKCYFFPFGRAAIFAPDQRCYYTSYLGSHVPRYGSCVNGK